MEAATQAIASLYPPSIEKFQVYLFPVATFSFRSSHGYIIFHAYSVVVCVGINQQRIYFNYSGKMAEQFFK